MAKSGARKETAAARPSATSPAQQFPGAPMSSAPTPPAQAFPGASTSCSPTPPAQTFPGAPTGSAPTPPPHFYQGAPASSSPNPSTLPFNQWRPTYTAAPEGLLGFGQFPPMHPYNFRPPPMHNHDQGHQNLENFHFVGSAPYDSFSTPPPPPHRKDASRSAPAKVDSTSSKKKRKAVNVDADGLVERTAYRLPYTPEEHVRLAGSWLECSLDPIDGNGKKGEQFWDDIAALYNSTTPSNRKRDRNQLKMEWQRTKKRLAAFHGDRGEVQ